MKSKNQIFNILFIFIFSLICNLCISYLLAKFGITNVYQFNPQKLNLLTGDQKEYYEIAKNIFDKHIFSLDGINSTTSRPPIYPLFISIILLLGNINLLIPIQKIISSLMIVLIYLIGEKAENKRLGLISAIAVSLYIPIQLQADSLLADVLFNFLLMGFLLIFLKSIEKPNELKLFAFSGIILALATLTRPVTLFLPFFLLIYIFMKDKLPIKSLFVFITVFILCIMPWTVRNINITGKITPIASFGSFNLWQSTYYSNVLYTTVKAMEVDKELSSDFKRIAKNDYYIDYQAEPRFMKEAIKRIIDKPFDYFRFCVERTLRAYTAFPGTRDWLETKPHLYFALSFIQVLLWVLGLLGLKEMKNPAKTFLLICLTYSILFHSLLSILSRYIIPWLPIVIISATFFILKRAEKLKIK